MAVGNGLRRAQVRLADAGQPPRRPASGYKGVNRRLAAGRRATRPPSTPSGEISTAAGGRPPAGTDLALFKIDLIRFLVPTIRLPFL